MEPDAWATGAKATDCQVWKSMATMYWPSMQRLERLSSVLAMERELL
jgi:hypothetical protein